MGNKTGRNEPCPCGSGKKYKKCCEATDQATQRAPAPNPKELEFVIDHDLDDLSNEIVDLIHDGRLDEAELRCAELRKKYPEMIDWREHTAAIHAARGNHAEALRYYKLAKEFAEAHEGFDEHSVEYFQVQIDELEAKIGNA